jgi:hypothetical protein
MVASKRVKVNATVPQADLALGDLVHLQDLSLLLQARGVDLDSREQRLRSRNRLQDFFQRMQQILQPEVTLEIGALKAQFSQRMARLGF